MTCQVRSMPARARMELRYPLPHSSFAFSNSRRSGRGVIVMIGAPNKSSVLSPHQAEVRCHFISAFVPSTRYRQCQLVDRKLRDVCAVCILSCPRLRAIFSQSCDNLWKTMIESHAYLCRYSRYVLASLHRLKLEYLLVPLFTDRPPSPPLTWDGRQVGPAQPHVLLPT